VLSVHVRWGDSTEARRQELELLADWIEGRRRDKCNEDSDTIVMGDFNIPSRTDALFKAVTKHGLQIPNALLGTEHGSNLEKNKRYDQILHHAAYPENFTNAGGVLDFYIDQNRIEELFPGGMTKTEFTYQMSDHLPLWMQINTDIDGQQLQQIVQGQG